MVFVIFSNSDLEPSIASDKVAICLLKWMRSNTNSSWLLDNKSWADKLKTLLSGGFCNSEKEKDKWVEIKPGYGPFL